MDAAPLMAFPVENTIEKLVVQVQVPLFNSRQVLVKAAPGARVVPSGMVTSVTKLAYRQGMDDVAVAVGGSGVFVAEGKITGVNDGMGVRVGGRGVAVLPFVG